MIPIDIKQLESFIDPNEAVYASVREVVSPHIVDMRIIYATYKAAELFGFESTNDIIGSYVSMLHNPEDITKTRRWSLLRHKGFEAPEEYHIRIQRNDGFEIPVNKRVNLITLEKTLVSISEQYELSRGSFQPLSPPSQDIITTQDMRDLWGIANIREAESVLNTYFNLTHGGPTDNVGVNMDTAMPKTGANRAIQKLHLNSDADYYLYKCLVCMREWISSVRLKPGQPMSHPKRCKFDDCRSTLWHNEAAALYARDRRNRSRK